jgi:large subunit ribosomal protein L3
MAGHYAKAGVEPGEVLREFRLDGDEGADLDAGGELSVTLFEVGQKVDVRGVTKGRGFAGTIRRHNFRSQDATHGNSVSHRAPGSIGQCQTPGRVFKGKRMAGHMGNVNRCQQNLEVIRVDTERNLLLVRGGVPGPAGGRLVVVPSVKQKNKKA